MTTATKLSSHEPPHSLPQAAPPLQSSSLAQRLLHVLADSSASLIPCKSGLFSRLAQIAVQLWQFGNLLSLLDWTALPEEYIWLSNVFKYSRADAGIKLLGGSLAAEVTLGLVVLLPLTFLVAAVAVKRPISAQILRITVGGGSWLASELLILPLSVCFLSKFMEFNSLFWGFLYFPSLFLICLHRNCLYNSQWRYPVLFARLKSSTVNKDLLVNQALVVIFLLFEGQSWRITGLQVTLGVYLGASYMVRSPYYCANVNMILSAKYCLFAWLAALLYLNSAVNQPDFLLFFACFGSCAFLMVFFCLYSQISLVFSRLYPRLSPVLALQRQLISLSLANNTEIEAVLREMKEKFRTRLEVGVWEALHHVASRELEQGRVRLGLWQCSGHWQVRFIRWKLRRTFQRALAKSHSNNEYFSYHQDSAEATSLDISACVSFQRFLTVYRSGASGSDLFAQAQRLCTAVARAKREYSHLRSLYPASSAVLAMQESFLSSLRGGNDHWNRRKAVIQGDSRPFLVICASEDKPGCVQFMNPSCCELLQRSMSEDEDLYLSSFLPACFSGQRHSEGLRSHIGTAQSGSFVHPRVFLVTHAPVGVQVQISAWIACNSKDVHYEATLNPLNSALEEFALVSWPDSRVEVRSSAFWSMLGLSDSLDLESAVEQRVEEAVQRQKDKGREVRLNREEYSLGQFTGVVLTLEIQAILPNPLSSTHCLFLNHAKPVPPSPNKSLHSVSLTAVPFLQRTKAKYVLLTSRLWTLQLGTSLILVLVLGVILSFYFDVFKALDSVSVVNDMGRRRFRTANILDCTRELQLIGAGLMPGHNATQVRTRLVQEVTDLKGILEGLRNLSIDWPPGPHRSMYYSPTVPIWEQHSGSLAFSKVPLFDAMSKIVSAASVVASVPSVNFTLPEALYVFRNGMGETMNFLNSSTFAYVATELEISRFIIERLTLATLLVSIGLLGMSVGVGMYLLWTLERLNAQVWTLLGGCSSSTLIKKYQLLADRVAELSGLEERESQGAETRRRQGKAQRLGGWVVLFLVIQSVGSVAFVTTLAMRMDSYVNTSLSSKIPYMNWAGMRRWLSTYNYVWLRELYLAQSSLYDYYQVNSANQLISAAADYSQNLTNLYQLTENHLIYGSSLSLIRDTGISARHFDLLFSSPCPQLSAVPNCSSTFLSKGVHYALQAYLLDLRVVQDLLRSGQSVSWADVQAVTKKGKTVGLGFAQAAIFYDEDGTDAVQRTVSELVLYIIAYLAAGLVYSGVGVGWAVRMYRKRLETVRKVCKWLQISE